MVYVMLQNCKFIFKGYSHLNTSRLTGIFEIKSEAQKRARLRTQPQKSRLMQIHSDIYVTIIMFIKLLYIRYLHIYLSPPHHTHPYPYLRHCKEHFSGHPLQYMTIHRKVYGKVINRKLIITLPHEERYFSCTHPGDGGFLTPQMACLHPPIYLENYLTRQQHLFCWTGESLTLIFSNVVLSSSKDQLYLQQLLL